MEGIRMDNKVAIVTGGSRGIGAAIVKQLIEDGFKIAIGERDNNFAQEFIASFPEKQIISFKTDVSNRDDVFNLVKQTVEHFGHLDVMINNAGISKEYPLLEMTSEEYDQLINVNQKGVLYGIQAAGKQFLKQKSSGKIINASSIGGYRVQPNHGGYASTKFAVRALTQAAARELGPYGITTNCYCPGYTMTPMMEKIVANLCKQLNVTKEQLFKSKGAEVALGRPAQPEDIANVVSFLASPKSDYINGQALIVDGGVVYK